MSAFPQRLYAYREGELWHYTEDNQPIRPFTVEESKFIRRTIAERQKNDRFLKNVCEHGYYQGCHDEHPLFLQCKLPKHYTSTDFLHCFHTNPALHGMICKGGNAMDVVIMLSQMWNQLLHSQSMLQNRAPYFGCNLDPKKLFNPNPDDTANNS